MIDECAVIEREINQKVTEETPLEDLQVDSLEYLALILAIEREAGKDIPPTAYADFSTVGDIARELA